MKTSGTTLTTFYSDWLNTILSLLPGGSAKAPAAEPTPKQEHVAATQEWEDEGGTVKPADKAFAEPAPGPKIPL
jgi:hypothetical protein